MVFQVNRKESNFVYTDYRLIVELSHDAQWFWMAARDAHGTTTNRVAMDNPEKWKDAIDRHPDKAQWTSAHTIPLRVAKAAMTAAETQTQPGAAVW